MPVAVSGRQQKREPPMVLDAIVRQSRESASSLRQDEKRVAAPSSGGRRDHLIFLGEKERQRSAVDKFLAIAHVFRKLGRLERLRERIGAVPPQLRHPVPS